MPTSVATPSEAAVIAAQEKAVAEELAKLPSVASLEAEISAIEKKKEELLKLQDAKINYGPGKPGKKSLTLPRLPKGLGQVSVNGELMEGVKALTHEQYENFVAIYNSRMEHERHMKYGQGLNDRDLSGLAGGTGVMAKQTGNTAKF